MFRYSAWSIVEFDLLRSLSASAASAFGGASAFRFVGVGALWLQEEWRLAPLASLQVVQVRKLTLIVCSGFPTSSVRLRVPNFEFQISGFRLRVSDFEVQTSRFRLRVSSFSLRPSVFELRAPDFEFQTSSFRLLVSDAEVRVSLFERQA
jgi:hypothetical protein